MSTRTRKSISIKGNAGAVFKMDFDGTTMTITVNGTTVAYMSATQFVAAVAAAAAGNFLPGTDDSYDIGSPTFRWQDIFLSGLMTGSIETAITAHSGGTQAAAYALTAQFNYVATAAAVGDSVKLPTAGVGKWVVISNGGANAIQVFGASTSTINGVATATGVPLPAGQTALFWCNATGTWIADLKRGMDNSQYNTDTSTIDVSIAVAKVAGARNCFLNMTGVLGAGKALTLPTAASIVATIPNAYVGQTYVLRIMNTSGGAFAWTVTTNTGLTLTGTMTIAQNTYREFLVTLTSLTAVAVQSLGQVIVA